MNVDEVIFMELLIQSNSVVTTIAKTISRPFLTKKVFPFWSQMFTILTKVITITKNIEGPVMFGITIFFAML